jgi:hypothetical protein
MNRILPASAALLALALGTAGCTSMPRQTARMPEPRTYAIVVADAHGLLAPADLQRVEIGVVQYLLDEGYVRHDQTYIHDVVHADVVFRVQIAWQNAAAGSFTVAEVVPSYSVGTPAGQYAAGAGPDYYGPDYYGPDYYDPWLYGDAYGYYDTYAYGPWGPFLGAAPFLPIFGSGHHHRSGPPLAHRPPGDDKKGTHHARPPGEYARWSPRWGDRRPPFAGDPAARRTPPVWGQDHPPRSSANPPPHRDRDRDDAATAPNRSWWQNRPVNGNRISPADASAPRPRPADSGSRSYPARSRENNSGYRPPPRPEYSSGRGYSPEPSRNYSPPPAPHYSAPAPAASPPPPAAAPAPAQSRDGDRDNHTAQK